MTTSAVFSVSQLNRQIKLWLEHDIGMVFVEGELSNVSKPSSGHYYFTLKDQQAQIRCAYFRNRQLTIGAELMQNGQRVVAHGRLSLYEARGDYQLIVESMRDYGLGELYRQFELLKTKLQQEGLFDRPRQALPKFPRCIGVITSPSGAALQDILTTLQRRYPLATVRIYASEVQGQQAHLQLIAALAKANQEAHAEVLILARGGGSIEDLWAFNQETLVRVVAHSHIPVVTGVGHETDFTMVDFVADLRAATPTAAAEAVTPDAAYLLPQIQHYAARLLLAAQASLQQAKFKIEQLTQKIISPKQRLQAQWQTLDYLEQRLLSGGIRMAHIRAQQLQAIEAKLQNNNPLIMLSQTKQSLHILTTKMQTHLKQRVQTLWQVLSTHMASLHALSPLATLDRGYSITQLDGAVVLHSQQVALHDRITVRLAHGHLLCEVLAKEVT